MKNINNINEKKALVFEETMKHICFDGWTNESLENSCKRLGLDPNEAYLLYKNGIVDFIEDFISRIDDLMLKKIDSLELSRMKTKEKILELIKIRFSLYEPYKSSIKLLLKRQIMPLNICAGAKMLWHSVDDIWYYAGDSSTDYNFYTKRITLAAVYSSTLIYWLNDLSENYENSWNFLEKRINDALRFGTFKKAVANFKNKCTKIPFLRLVIKR